MTSAEIRLQQALAALGHIQRRLSLSLSEDARFFPVSPASLQGEDHDAIRARDAFLQRFGQATDHVLRKLFPRLQAAISGSVEVMTIRELLEALHRADLIDAPQTWMGFLEVRNRLAHDYALDLDELAQALNEAWQRTPLLLQQIDRARAYALEHGLTEGT